MERGWVAGPRGDYLVLAGTARAVRQETEESSEVARGVLFGGLLWFGARRMFPHRGRGRVEVRWHDESWSWSTRDEQAAYAAAAVIVDMITDGTWVPQEMHQPPLPGAEIGPY